jgi:hypothetical protein
MARRGVAPPTDRINNPALDPEHAKAAWRALGRAESGARPPTERALIAALARRYADLQPSSKVAGALDQGYTANAMRAV